MNMAVARKSRLAVSPYARRLARERDLSLEALHGSGPGGRILAADVLDFVPVDAPVELPVVAPAPPTAAPSIAAFATSIALSPLHELLAALESSGKAFDIHDILLRAAGWAFVEISDPAKVGEAPVALELDKRQVVFATTWGIPLTSLRDAARGSGGHTRRFAKTRRPVHAIAAGERYPANDDTAVAGPGYAPDSLGRHRG